MNRILCKSALALAAFTPAAIFTHQANASAFDSDVAKQAARVLAAYEKHGMFDGAVLLATNGKVVFKNGYGVANRDRGIPNTTDTKFSIASLGKAITAHLVLTLVEEGRVSLESPIATYLPALNKRIADKVTVHHLLTHSSGLSWWASDDTGYETRSYSLEELVKRAEGLNLHFEPGSHTRYSNSGYNLLAAIIERVTGKTFEDAMRERIFKPAGMRDTGFAWLNEVVARRATGYDRLSNGKYTPSAPNNQSYAIGAGGLYSTVEDMFRWNMYLDRELATELRDLMFKSHVGGNGYGWGIGRYGTKDGVGGKYALGMGGTFGFATVQSRCLDDGHYIIILSNVRQLDQSSITNDLVNLILGYEVTPPTGPTGQ